MSKFASSLRLRAIELPRRSSGEGQLYDLANGPGNPRGYRNEFEYLDPTGDIAVLLVDHFTHD